MFIDVHCKCIEGETAHISDFRWSCFSLSRKCTTIHKKYKALHNVIDSTELRNTFSKKEIQSERKKYKVKERNARPCIMVLTVHSQRRNLKSQNKTCILDNVCFSFQTFCPSKWVILTEKLSYSDWRNATWLWNNILWGFKMDQAMKQWLFTKPNKAKPDKIKDNSPPPSWPWSWPCAWSWKCSSLCSRCYDCFSQDFSFWPTLLKVWL